MKEKVVSLHRARRPRSRAAHAKKSEVIGIAHTFGPPSIRAMRHGPMCKEHAAMGALAYRGTYRR
jgi:hypothetical protein